MFSNCIRLVSVSSLNILSPLFVFPTTRAVLLVFRVYLSNPNKAYQIALMSLPSESIVPFTNCRDRTKMSLGIVVVWMRTALPHKRLNPWFSVVELSGNDDEV